MAEHMSASFEPVVRLSAIDQAIATIKAMIVDGELRPHERLPSERNLAEMLNVSRPTVREAVHALNALNIVESRHGHGTFVTSLEPRLLAAPVDFALMVNDDTLSGYFEARSIIESRMAALAAERAKPDELERLEELVREYGERLDDSQAAASVDLAFHRALADAAHSPILAAMLESMGAIESVTRRTSSKVPDRRSVALQQLAGILDAVRRGDQAAAAACMQEHVDHAFAGYRA